MLDTSRSPMFVKMGTRITVSCIVAYVVLTSHIQMGEALIQQQETLAAAGARSRLWSLFSAAVMPNQNPISAPAMAPPSTPAYPTLLSSTVQPASSLPLLPILAVDVPAVFYGACCLIWVA